MAALREFSNNMKEGGRASREKHSRQKESEMQRLGPGAYLEWSRRQRGQCSLNRRDEGEMKSERKQGHNVKAYSHCNSFGFYLW